MTRRALRPTQMAGLAMAGACLMTASLLIVTVPRSWLPPSANGLWETLWSRRWLVLVGVSPLLVGGGLTLWAKRRLNRSFLDNQWSEAEVAAVLRIVNFRRWQIGGLFFFLGWLVLLLYRHTLMGGGLFYLLVMPSQTAQSIRSRIAPKVPAGTGLTGLGSFARLRSEHWGQSRS